MEQKFMVIQVEKSYNHLLDYEETRLTNVFATFRYLEDAIEYAQNNKEYKLTIIEQHAY